MPTVPTNVSAFSNDPGYAKTSDIPAAVTKRSQLTNDSGFVTSSALNTKVDTGNVTQTLAGTYTVTGTFNVPTPPYPTE
jgi:hypothetical protein